MNDSAPAPRDEDDFRRRVLVGVAWTAAQKWALRVAGLATYIALGRLLGPADIGLAALALAIIGVLTVLADVGTTAFLIRAPSLDPRTCSTAFWTNLVFCCLGATFVIAVSEPLATLVQQPGLAPVLRALTPSLLFAGLAATPTALLTRDLRMRTLALRDLIAAGLAMAVGVSAALAGAGVWALVAQSLTQAFVALLVVWRTAHWRPELTFSLATAASVIRFGGAVSGTNLLQSIHDRLEQFVLGSIAGTSALGYWTVGTRMLNLVYDISMAVLDAVALPVFARARANLPLLRRTFATATAHGLVLLLPLLMVLGVAAPVIIPLVFSERWNEAVAPMQVLCLTYALGGLSWFSRPAFVAQARTGTELLVSFFGLALHLVAVAVAAPHGLLALSWAVTAEAVVIIALRIWLQDRLLSLPPAVYQPSVLVLAAGIGMVGISLAAVWVGGTLSWPVVIVAVTLGVAGYVGLLMLVNRSLVREIIGDLRRVARR